MAGIDARTPSAAAPPVRTDPAPERPRDPIAELRFLHRVAGSRDDRPDLGRAPRDRRRRDARCPPGERVVALPARPRRDDLTLAATNGLDRYQIGRARVPFGEGVTGRVAATREPMVIPDVSRRRAVPVGPRHRPAPVHRLDAVGARCAWDDQVVGVLNVQTEDAPRLRASPTSPTFARSPTCSPGSSRRAASSARPRRRSSELKAIDQARTELIALVTHELRTPLAVVRAYTDLLSEEPAARRPRVARPRAPRPARGLVPAATMEQIERLDRLVDSILASVRVVPDQPADLVPIDVAAARRASCVSDLGPLLAQPPASRSTAASGCYALADPSRLRQILEHLRRERREVRPARHDDHDRLALVEGGVRIGVTDEGPGIPEEWRDRIFEPYARARRTTARGSGIGLYAAKRLAESMGARLWCEPAHRRRAPGSSSRCPPPRRSGWRPEEG